MHDRLTFTAWLREQMGRRLISVDGVACELSLPVESVEEWLTGKSAPSRAVCDQVAGYFGAPPSWVWLLSLRSLRGREFEA